MIIKDRINHVDWLKFDKRIYKNSFYNILGFITPLLFLLIFTPILIHKMGLENYGLWTITTSTIGLTGIADFGISTMITKYIAENIADNDKNELSATIIIGFVAEIIFGIIFLIILYYYAPNIANLFHSTSILFTQIIQIIKITSFGSIPYLLQAAANSIPQGLQRYDLSVYQSIGSQFLKYIAAIYIISVGGSIYQIILSTIIVLWIVCFISWIIAIILIKSYFIKPKFVYSRQKNKLLYAFYSGLSGLGSAIFSYADKIMVASVLSFEAVSYYSIVIGIATKILQLSGAITASLMPATSIWNSKKNYKYIYNYFINFNFFIITLNIIIMLIMIIFSEKFLQLWMGANFTKIAIMPFKILIIIYTIITLNTTSYHIANGMGYSNINAIFGIIGGLLTIGLIKIFGEIWGINGAAMANIGYFITLFIPIIIFIKIIYLNKSTLNT